MLQTEIVHRQHIATPEAEDQKHLRGPPADAFDLRDIRNHFLVAEPRESSERQHTGRRLGRQVAQITDFLPRNAGSAELATRRAQQLHRRGQPSAPVRSIELLKARRDGLRGLERKLLVEDRFGQRAEFIPFALLGQPTLPYASNYACQHRVDAFQVTHGSRDVPHRQTRYRIDRRCESGRRADVRFARRQPSPQCAKGSATMTAGSVSTARIAMERLNYFNYFTEIEEHFWRKRGAHILVSPLDWAIVETWQKAGIPLEAVLRGIDRAFESYQRSRRGLGGRPLKSLVYCVDAVLEAAAELQQTAAGTGPEPSRPKPSAEPFSREELHNYLRRNAERLHTAAEKVRSTESGASLAAQFEQTAARLAELESMLDAPGVLDLEELERRLTVLEEKLAAGLTASADEALLLRLRRELDRALAPYRRRMTAEQLAQLERQYLQKRLFEEHGVPRLSLFYLS